MRILLASLTAVLVGCFAPPHNVTPPPDGGGTGPGISRVNGSLCALTDVRDPKTCTALAVGGNVQISVEETHQSVVSDGNGQFTLTLSPPRATFTLVASDARGRYAGTVTPVRAAGSATATVALPLFSLDFAQQLVAGAGHELDPGAAQLIAWLVTPDGHPAASVGFQRSDGFTDGAGENQLVPGNVTHAFGLVALFGQTPGAVTLTLTPPPGARYTGGPVTLPLRAGAFTLVPLALTASR